MNGDFYSRISSRLTCYRPRATTDIMESINNMHCHHFYSCTIGLSNPHNFSTHERARQKQTTPSTPTTCDRTKKSCPNTKDPSPTELPNAQCKPRGLSHNSPPKRKQPALRNKISSIIPDTHHTREKSPKRSPQHTSLTRAFLAFLCIDRALRSLEA